MTEKISAGNALAVMSPRQVFEKWTSLNHR